MGISLSKGGNLSLEKTDPGIQKVVIGLGWDLRTTDGASFDLDASAFMLNIESKASSDSAFIFYNQKKSECGSVEHKGDNLTGEGAGDDETITVNLLTIPNEIQKIVIAVTIHDAEIRKQNFGQVSNAYIRIVNQETNNEVCRYDLTEDSSTETAMIFGELYKHNNEWKFRAVGQGFQGGLGAMAREYGINVT